MRIKCKRCNDTGKIIGYAYLMESCECKKKDEPKIVVDELQEVKEEVIEKKRGRKKEVKSNS